MVNVHQVIIVLKVQMAPYLSQQSKVVYVEQDMSVWEVQVPHILLMGLQEHFVLEDTIVVVEIQTQLLVQPVLIPILQETVNVLFVQKAFIVI